MYNLLNWIILMVKGPCRCWCACFVYSWVFLLAYYLQPFAKCFWVNLAELTVSHQKKKKKKEGN